jgi:hypothetical protein
MQAQPMENRLTTQALTLTPLAAAWPYQVFHSRKQRYQILALTQVKNAFLL